MSLKNTNTNSQGFTIVELLIVIVVIAILAAITIVSYNGITNRANTSASAATASTVQKKAEMFNADGGTNKYPLNVAVLTGATTDKSYYLSNVTGQAAELTTASTTNTITYRACISGSSPANQAAITASTITGVYIGYLNYATSAMSYISLGDVGTPATACPAV